MTAPWNLLTIEWKRQIRHWFVAVLLVISGIALSEHFDEDGSPGKGRYLAYQFLQKTYPQDIHARVVLVEIGDTEFWKGELDRRIPIKRDYLARLVRALDRANAAVIAVDYDLRSPVPDGSLIESPAYEKETKYFIDTIEEVSHRRFIVLPSSVNEYTGEDIYDVTPSIYDNHKFLDSHVSMGFINLYPDTRYVPITLKLRGQKQPAKSFSLAISLAADPRTHYSRKRELQDESVIRGPFMSEKEFPRVGAGEVLANEHGAWVSEVASRVVIIGNFTRHEAFGLGEYTDSFPTPVGKIPGAVVHANYVEAWADSRVIGTLQKWSRIGLEALISLAVSWLFVRKANRLRYFLVIVSAILVLSYVMLVNFGIYFDFYLPLIFVAGHGFIEKLLRSFAELRRLRSTLPVERS